jgi:hypothetical protein
MLQYFIISSIILGDFSVTVPWTDIDRNKTKIIELIDPLKPKLVQIAY